MSRTNYNAMSKQNNEDLENQVQEPDTVNVPATPDPEPEVEESTVEFGFVSDCAKLNVRKEPDVKAEVICVIDNNTEVYVDMSESTEDFYKVCGESGFEGYCMKKYITIE